MSRGLTVVAPKHEAEPRTNLDVVPASRAWIRMGSVVVVALLVVLLFGLVGFNAMIVRNQSSLDELDRDITELTRSNQQMRFDVAELEAPERIRQTAVAELGMMEPESVIYLDPIASAELERPSNGGSGGG